MDNIRVAVRARPLIKREQEAPSKIYWTVNENSIYQTGNNNRPIPSSTYYFDHVFGNESDNRNVYKNVSSQIVKAAMEGFNGTIFAYGQTSSGKTHTMMGNANDPGVIPMAVNEIFGYISQKPNREFLLRVSYMEIYNEVITDLLNPSSTNLKIHENQKREVYVGNLTESIVNTPSQILTIMTQGETHRHIGETNMNERSSRSHTIFRMIIESREREKQDKADSENDNAVKVSVLNLVDLAGSERVSQTGSEGIRLKEGGYINKSLLTLGTVIAKLSEGEGNHIPFRDSKLTRILQSSLGGNSLTAIICTVTPVSLDETSSTLKFASRAKKIQNRPEMNEVVDDETLMRRYRKEINKLRRQLARKTDTYDNIEELKMENALIKEKMQNLTKLIYSSTSISPTQRKAKRASRRETWCPGHIQLPSFANILELSGNHLDQTDAENPSLSDDETTEILKVHKRARLGSDPLSNIKSESRIDDEMPESEMKEEDIKLICDDIHVSTRRRRSKFDQNEGEIPELEQENEELRQIIKQMQNGSEAKFGQTYYQDILHLKNESNELNNRAENRNIQCQLKLDALETKGLEIQQVIDNFKAELNRLKESELDDIDDVIEEQYMVIGVEAAIQSLTNQLYEYSQLVEILKLELNAKECIISNLQEYKRNTSILLHDQEEKITLLQDNCQKLEQYQSAKDKLEESMAQLQHSEDSKEAMEHDDDYTTILLAENDDLSEKLVVLKDEYAKEKSQFEIKLTELTNDKEYLEKEIQDLSIAIDQNKCEYLVNLSLYEKQLTEAIGDKMELEEKLNNMNDKTSSNELTKQLEEANQSIDTLTQELSTAKQQLNDEKNCYEELKGNYDDLMTTSSSEKNNDEINQLMADIKSLTQELDEVRDCNKMMQAEKDELTDGIDLLKQELLQLKEDNNQMEDKLKLMEADNNVLKDNVQDNNNAYQELSASIEILKQDLAQAQDNISELQLQNTTLQQEKLDLLDQFDVEKKNMQLDNASLKEQVSSLEEKNKLLHHQLDIMEEESNCHDESTSTIIATLQEDIQKIKEEKCVEVDHNKVLENRLKQADDENTELQDQCELLYQEVLSQRELKDKLQDELNTLQSEFESEKVSLISEVTTLKETIQSIEEQLQRNQIDSDNELMEKKRLTEERLVQMEQQCKELQHEVDTMKDSQAKLITDIEECSKDEEKVAYDSITELEASIQADFSDFDLRNEEIKLQDNLKRLTNEYADAEQQIISLKQTIDLNKEEINKLQEDNNKLKVQLQTSTLTENDCAAVTSNLEENNKQLTNLQEENESLKVQLEKIADMEGEICNLTDKIEENNKQIDLLQQEKITLTNTIDEYHDKMNIMKEESQEVKAENVLLKDTIEEIEQNIKLLHEENSDLKNVITENEKQVGLLQEENANHQKENIGLQELNKDHQQITDNLANAEEEIISLKTNLEQYQQQLNVYQTDKINSDEEMNNLKSIIEGNNKQMETLQEENVSNCEEIAAMKHLLETNGQTLESLLKEKATHQEEYGDLKVTVEEYKINIQSLQDENNKLMQQVDTLTQSKDDENTALIHTKEQNEKQIATLKEENNDLNQQLINLGRIEEENHQLIHNIEENEKQATFLNEENQRLQHVIDEISQQLTTAFNEVGGIKHKYQDLQEVLQEDANKLTTLTDDNDKMKEENHQQHLQIEQLQEENFELVERLNEIIMEQKSVDEIEQKYINQLNEIKAEKDTTIATIKELEESLSRITEERNEYKANHSAALSKIEQIQDQLAQTQAFLDEKKHQCQALTDDIQQLNHKLENAQDDYKQIKEKLDLIKFEWNEKVSECEYQIEEKDDEIHHLKTEIDTLHQNLQEHQVMKDNIAHLQNQLVEAEQKMASIQEEKENVITLKMKEIDQINDQFAIRELKWEEMKEEMEEAIRSRQEEREVLNENEESLKAEIKEHKTHLQKLEESHGMIISQLKDQAVALREELEGVNTNYANVMAENDSLKKDINVKLGEIDTLANENNALQANQVKLEDFIKNKELETDYQQQKLNTKLQHADKEAQYYRKQMKELEKIIDDQEDELQESRNEVNAAKDKLSKVNESIASYHTEIAELQENNKTILNKIATLEKERAIMEKSLKDSRELIDYKEAKLKKCRNEIRKMKEEHHNGTIQLTDKARESESSLTNNAKFYQLEAKIKMLEDSNRKLTASLKEKSTDQSKLQHKIENKNAKGEPRSALTDISSENKSTKSVITTKPLRIPYTLRNSGRLNNENVN